MLKTVVFMNNKNGELFLLSSLDIKPTKFLLELGGGYTQVISYEEADKFRKGSYCLGEL